ncbi:MAG: hypothetical protein IJ783_00675 [Kiritimatiellae bacterium]|nr:hypothetical protein [Kiritimatiellia bacterium]
MRGFAKRLKPLVTPTLYRAMEGLGPEAGYALFMWYHDAYTRMTTEVERLDDQAATVDEIAEALDALELPPPPFGTDATLASIIRGEAQDLIEAAVVKTFSARDKKRAQRIRAAAQIKDEAAALEADLRDDRPEDDPGDSCPDCPACPGDNRDNGGQRGQAGQRGTTGTTGDARPPPSPGPLSSFSDDIDETDNQRARTRARVEASKTSGSSALTREGGAGPDGASRKREVPHRDWRHYRNPEGRDPVDIVIEATGEDPADPDARRCWGAYLRDMGVEEFLECLHAVEVDSEGNERNFAAVLNERMRIRCVIMGKRKDTKE